MYRLLTVICLLMLATLPLDNCSSQESTEKTVTPEKMGFTALNVKNKNSTVRYYVSTEGKPLDKSRKLPLVLYLDGSGPSPLFWIATGRVGSSLMFDARDFTGYHFAVISKPGINFFEPAMRVKSEIYDECASLRWRVDAANAVVDQLASEEFIDTSRILVMGHSEGSDVAPRVALENSHVTHVAGLAAGGMSLMDEYIIFFRKEIAAGDLSQSEGEDQILDIKNDFRKIFADPRSTTKKWSGEAYLRWSTFFEPSINSWKQIEKPVYLGICRYDVNTPVESGEAIELEFIRLGKTNMTSKVWPCDHYFVEPAKDKESKPTDRRMDVLREIMDWVKT